MIAEQSNDYFCVGLDADDIAAFAAAWPRCDVPHEPCTLFFHKRSADLLDITDDL